jgi:hypothetical protein
MSNAIGNSVRRSKASLGANKMEVKIIKLLHFPFEEDEDCVFLDVVSKETLKLSKKRLIKLERINIGDVETNYFLSIKGV